MQIDGVSYELVQLHFHTPSEHTIEGEQAAGEVHLVHQDDAGNLAVLGVLIQEGAENPALATILEHASEEACASQDLAGAVDPNDFFPNSTTYVSYDGSLTTPSCTEGVSWTVFMEPITASAEQLEALESYHGKNARPVQDLTGREVTLVGVA